MKTKLLFGFIFFAFQFAVAKEVVFVDPVAPSLSPITYCNPNNDGFGVFDLIVQNTVILAAQSGAASDYAISYHETLTDAEIGAFPIGSPYYNISPWIQTIYYRVRNLNTSTYAVGSFELVVNTTPIVVSVSSIAVCDTDANPLNGSTSVDLTQQTAAILALQPLPASNYGVSYYTTLVSAENGISPILSDTNYIGSNGQTIWYRVENNSSGCFNVGSFQLVVNSAPFATGPQFFADCDNYSNPYDGVGIIDLTLFAPSILNGQNPATHQIKYFVTQADAISGTNQILLSSAQSYQTTSTTIWVKVINSSGCYAITTINITINSAPLVFAPTPLALCDSDATPNNQYTTFDLTVKNNEITQGVAGTTVVYYPSLANAQAGTNPINAPTTYINSVPTLQTLGVRVYDATPLSCLSITTLDIRVYPIPTPYTNPNQIAVCDSDGDGFELVDLTVNSSYIINGDPNLVLHFYPTMADALANVNQILTPTVAVVGGNVWIRVENNRIDYQGNHCYVLVEQPIIINSLPNINLVSNNTLNTVYVDGSNNVVQGLTLDAQLSGNYTFAWQVDGAPIPAVTSSVYTVNTASPTGTSRTFVVTATDLSTGCAASSSIVVVQSTGTPSPLGPIIQPYNPGDTLAYLTVTGSNILWYAAASGKNATTTNSTPLPLSTLLQNGATYYASQTIGGVESIARLPVTVYAALGVPGNEIASLQFAPNPVKNNLTLQSAVIIKSVSVYTILDQKVFEKNYNDTNIRIDLSILTTGNYILKAQGETGEKTIRIIKE